MKKLVIFDGNSLMNRAFYGVRPLTTKDGLYTNAVFGYINILKKHLDAINPDFAAVAFDLKAPTFRHKMFSDYKGTRKGMPPELQMQVPFVREVTVLLGLHCLTKEGFEADDILGTVAKTAEENDLFSYIVTGDRDSLQLVSATTSVIIASMQGDVENTPATVMEKYGVSPRQLIEVKALAGDTSDNIPGVAGIGEKTACKLIFENQTIENLYASLDNTTYTANMKEKLTAGKENAFLSRKLAEICTDVPDIPTATDLGRQEIDKDGLRALFIKLEFSRLFSRFGLEEVEKTPIISAPNETENAPPKTDGQLSLDFEDQPTVSLLPLGTMDASTFRPCGDEPCFFYEQNNACFVRIKDESYQLTGDIAPWLKESKNLVVLNAKEYYRFARNSLGFFPPENQVIFDAFLAAYLINPADHAADISRLSMRYLSRMLTPTEQEDPATILSLLSALYPILSEQLKAIGAEKLYFDVDLPLARTLAKMEHVGFKVSKEGLLDYGKMLREQMAVSEQEIYNLAGYTFNINSPKQLGTLLFEKMGLPFAKKNSRGFSTDAETLEKLRPHAPIVEHILQYRQLSKLYSTYIEGLVAKISPTDGRIHSTFNQTLTQTGRLSSNEPNLQNIPVRTDLGRELRRFFIAENQNYTLVDADYSQIELRILAHVAADAAMQAAFSSGQDIHTTTAAQIFHIPAENVTPQMRKYAKAVNFGIVYGISSFSLATDIGTTRAEAAAYIERYFDTYPEVRRYLKEIVEKAAQDGYVSTLFGRRRYIPELSASNKNTRAFGERVAMNTPIQGTAADIIKLAMVNVDRRLEKENRKTRLILQVHDELILEAPREEAEEMVKLLREEMENAVSLSVTLLADVHIGDSWFDAK